MVAAVGAVELERALTAAKCFEDVPVGDLEELLGEPGFDVLGSAWSVWIAVLTVAHGAADTADAHATYAHRR